MTALYIILAASPVLLLGAFLVVIVAGIRRRDRGGLAAPDRNRVDAITRRMTGLSIRNCGKDGS
jgi:hypothetical protein